MNEVAYRHLLLYEAIKKAINGIVITDEDGIIVFWNGGAERMFGWLEAEVKGKSIEIIIPKAAREAHRKGMERLKATGESKVLDRPMEVDAVHRFDEIIPVSITISKSNIGTVVHFTAVIKNIRERREEQARYDREMRLYLAGEKLDVSGVWEWDIQTNEVVCSAGFNELFQIEDRVNDADYLMQRVYYKDRELVQKAIAQAIQTQKDYCIKYRISKLSGAPLAVICKAKLFYNKNGTLVKIIGVIRKHENYE